MLTILSWQASGIVGTPDSNARLTLFFSPVDIGSTRIEFILLIDLQLRHGHLIEPTKELARLPDHHCCGYMLRT
ncbi:hypothetical protein DN820_08325 [Stutzerimonas nosocomialis]|uniref:Uncharacterized protein n=1 Tax=Stutzerimonas nosocomialis TaxID=1056496 RepID=A0A5R9QFQ8_9GAMM|nr:hypothetical protein DN820_08325 [Stutzerimonas nosocomialis]